MTKVNIDSTVFSFSKLSTFETCKYLWYKLYVPPKADRKTNAFSQYGLLIHEILEQYELDEIDLWDLVSVYKNRYNESVTENFPPNKFVELSSRYYIQGVNYLTGITETELLSLDLKTISVEEEFNFYIDDNGKERKFKGFIDRIAKRKSTGEIIIIDHKSKAIETANDDAAKSAWKQLSLYSIPVLEKYGQVDEIWINSFRRNVILKRKFTDDMAESAKAWALKIISDISKEDDWPKCPDSFFCNFLCDLRDTCGKDIRFKNKSFSFGNTPKSIKQEKINNSSLTGDTYNPNEIIVLGDKTVIKELEL